MNPPNFHTPYDGSSKPFTIGLSALDVKDWIAVDSDLPIYLAEKRRLYAELPEKVLVAEEATEAAQQEVWDLLAAHLEKYFPALVHVPEAATPLARAALLVQEDLVLMRRSPEGWRLVAASLCFPSAWNLLEKFRRPLNEIHAPVPGFGAGTRNASLIERMFDNLSPARPVLRWNWSLHDDAKLFHPYSNSGPGRRFGDGDIGGKVFLRLERQTLRKLERSGDMLFTIRIFTHPLEALERQPNGAELAAAIAQQLTAMTTEEADYKGIADERARLIERLGRIKAKA